MRKLTFFRSNSGAISVVATDDKRIADCCRSFGAHVVMTSETCANGELYYCSCLPLPSAADLKS